MKHGFSLLSQQIKRQSVCLASGRLEFNRRSRHTKGFITGSVSFVTSHFEKLRTLKKKLKCVKFGNSQRTLKKNIFFQSALIWGILTHFEKNPKNHILHGRLYLSYLEISNIIIKFENTSISSNALLTIRSICCSFVMGLKKYSWDKSGFASCK